MGRWLAVAGSVLVPFAAGSPARAECFNCNYELVAALFGLFVVAAITGLIGAVYLVLREPVPLWIKVVFGFSAIPPLAVLLAEVTGLI